MRAANAEKARVMCSGPSDTAHYFPSNNLFSHGIVKDSSLVEVLLMNSDELRRNTNYMGNEASE
jgi:hypothetical protein